jgi:tetratricopeptide (TPR) repeat protein
MNLLETERLFQRAEQLREDNQYHIALLYFKKALRQYNSEMNLEGRFLCQLAIGDIYRMTGDFEKSGQYYEDAIETGKITELKSYMFDAEMGLGLAHRARGEWRIAMRLFNKAFAFYKKRNDSHGIAFCLWAIAGTLRIKGDIINAIEWFREGKVFYARLKYRPGVGYCLCGLGGASRIAGRFKDSLKYYRQAHKLFTSLHDTFGTAYSFCGIGNAHRMLGNYQQALADFKKASLLYELIGDRVSYSYTLWSIGTTYKMMNKFASAMDHFRKAQALFKATKDPRGIIYCRLGMGEIAFLRGRIKLGLRYALSSIESARSYGFKLEACHAEMLRTYIIGNSRRSCYNKLGLQLQFEGAPFNIP